MTHDWPAQLDAHEAAFDSDALGAAAAEYVAAESRTEPFWRSLLGIVLVFALVALACAEMYLVVG